MLLLPVACSGNDSPSEGSRRIVVGANAAPNSMDPTTVNTAAIPEALLYNVYETLVKTNSDGNYQPLLAKSYAISDDRLTYTFELQDNATFSSGRRVDAQAVVANMERIINDESVLPMHKQRMSVVDEVKAVDASTVEFTLNTASNNWFFQMTQSMGIIADPDSFADMASHPVGSGPFVVNSWIQGDSVTLDRNENYWSTPSQLGGVTFRYYSDANAENAALLSGNLDVIANVAAPQALSQFYGSDRYTVLEGTTTGEVILAFNHQSPGLQDVRVRQAITYAIDRKGLRDAVWAGYGELIGSMVPPTDPWYEDLSDVYSYDPARARELLNEAGVGDLHLRLRIPSLPYGPGAAAYIASQLEDVGIDVTVDELEFPATWIDEVMKQSNYDMTVINHAESRDITNFANPDYYWHYNNQQFQELIAAADQADEEAQIQYYRSAARILADDAAADFLWLMPRIVVTTSNITGIEANTPALSFDLTRAEFTS